MKKDKTKCAFMTRNEVMEYLGISQNTFYRHFAINLQGYTVGNRIKYKREDVDALLKRV
ncbi:MAG: helix-turn-helix domain-containing protein [Clostridiales bacterium]|nr:helix-turn-helix domain-containing protein [Clostridiales bacterium]